MNSIRRLVLSLQKRIGVQRGALFVVVYACVVAFLILRLVPEVVILEVGQASPRFIGAPRVVEDRYSTTKLRQEAAHAVAEVFEQDPSVLERVMKDASDMLHFFRLTAVEDMDSKRKAEVIRAKASFDISDGAINTGLTVDEPTIEQLLTEFTLALEPVYKLGIKVDGLENARKNVVSTLQSSSLKAQHRMLMIEIARGTMRPNMRHNESATQRFKNEAVARVNPVLLQKGQKVIGMGEIATDREITLLQDLGLLRTGLDWRVISGSLLLALLVLAVPCSYLYLLSSRVFRKIGVLMLLGVIYVFTALFSLGLSTLSGYLLPIAAASILVTVLVDAKVGLITGCSLSLLAAGFVGFEARFVIVALLGAATGVFAVSHLEQRGGLVRGGIIVGVVNALGIAAFGLLFGSTGREILRDVLFGFGGGVLSSILAIGSLPFLENTFGVTSTIKLAELANPHQELLKRLLVEAPGTYHHSIIVANLAEAAAEQVGADALRARVGAYYHDVGKIERPYFFIENQTMMENPHNDYPPHLSSLIITSHVKDGVKLAREYNVPEVIIDILREHHGTSLVQYFFNKAQELGSDVREEDFVYEGPRPRTRESAIVMLADIVEAAVRSITSPTPAKIEQKVRDLIKEKLYTGQLDESDLTLRDLDKIGTAFVRHLSGIFHHRIEYPEQRGGKPKHASVMEQRAGQAHPSSEHRRTPS